jgi:hypothetical protein
MDTQAIDRSRVHELISSIFEGDLHAKRVVSLGNAVVGVLEGAALGIHAIGRALAVAAGLESRHAVKQVDRLLSNSGVDVWQLFGSWVPFVIGERPEIVAALDWTDYDADDQSTLVLSMVTSHGRATPLVWKTVVKSKLKGWRNEHEDKLLDDPIELGVGGLQADSVRYDRPEGAQERLEAVNGLVVFGSMGARLRYGREGELSWSDNGRSSSFAGVAVVGRRREAGPGSVACATRHSRRACRVVRGLAPAPL